MILAFSQPLYSREIEVFTLSGSWADFQKDSNIINEGLYDMVENYLDGPMLIDRERFSREELEILGRAECLRINSEEKWTLTISRKCFYLLSLERRQVFYDFMLVKFDEFMPSYGVTIRQDQKAVLKQQLYTHIHHPDLQIDSEIEASTLLSQSASQYVWKMPDYSTFRANCFGTAIASEATRTLPFYLRKIWPDILKNFQLITDQSDWEFGDLIVFEAGDGGHAMVYLGTDRETQKKMVFTKNGVASSPFQIMSYDDVYKIYYSEMMKVIHYRINQSFSFVPENSLRSEQAEMSLIEKRFKEFLSNSKSELAF